jgi:hypothetical protein
MTPWVKTRHATRTLFLNVWQALGTNMRHPLGFVRVLSIVIQICLTHVVVCNAVKGADLPWLLRDDRSAL